MAKVNYIGAYNNKSIRRSALSNLRRARKIIEKAWTKGAFHIGKGDYHGGKVSDRDLYCAIGAIQKVDGKGEYAAMAFLGQAVYEMAPRRGIAGSGVMERDRIIAFNDNRRTKHEEVIAAFDRAIALAEGTEV